MKEPRTRKKTKEPVQGTPPSREEIARRAYELFMKRGGEPGHEQEDWLQAELILREEKTRPS